MNNRQRRAIVYKLRDAKSPCMFKSAGVIILAMHILPIGVFLIAAIINQS